MPSAREIRVGGDEPVGLFSMNYNRPGPGIPKNAPPQKAVPRFFSILGRKFFDLVKLNLLFCVPAAAAAALMYGLGTLTKLKFLVLLPVVALSPFVAGLTFVTRNYAREEHAFILSDFKDAVRENWKPFLINGAVCYLLFTVLSYSIPFYWQNSAGNPLFLVAASVCIAVSALLVFSQYYVPVMIVTFRLNLRQIYKNALIFSILGLGRNLLVTALLAVLAFLLFLSSAVPLLLVLAALFTVFLLFAYCSFLINFAVYPLINKTMIQPYQKQQREKQEQQGGGNGPPPTFMDSDK